MLAPSTRACPASHGWLCRVHQAGIRGLSHTKEQHPTYIAEPQGQESIPYRLDGGPGLLLPGSTADLQGAVNERFLLIGAEDKESVGKDEQSLRASNGKWFHFYISYSWSQPRNLTDGWCGGAEQHQLPPHTNLSHTLKGSTWV